MYFKQSDKLNLPNELFQKLKDDIFQHNICQTNFRKTVASGTGITRWIYQWFFKNGWFNVHRINPELESQILDYYQPIINELGTPKIRLKVSHDVRALIPHSDSAPAYPEGDHCSIVIVIKGNNEITSWYDRGSDCTTSLWNLLTMRKVESVTFKEGTAYLFNNSQVHGVSNFKPGTTRYLLSISWKEHNYDALLKAYEKYYNN